MADEKVTDQQPAYSREALAASKRYASKRDTVMVALQPGVEYTIEDADKAIDAFLKRPVNEKVIGGND